MEVLISIFYKFFSFINFHFFSGSSLKLRKLAKVYNGDSIYFSAGIYNPAYVEFIFHDIRDYKNFIKAILLDIDIKSNWYFYYIKVLKNNNIVVIFNHSYSDSKNNSTDKKSVELELSLLELFTDIVANNSIFDIKVENNKVITTNGYSYYISPTNKTIKINKDGKELVVKNVGYFSLSGSCFEALKLTAENIYNQNKILYNIEFGLDDIKSFRK